MDMNSGDYCLWIDAGSAQSSTDLESLPGEVDTLEIEDIEHTIPGEDPPFDYYIDHLHGSEPNLIAKPAPILPHTIENSTRSPNLFYSLMAYTLFVWGFLLVRISDCQNKGESAYNEP